jgi:hypothetical protein
MPVSFLVTVYYFLFFKLVFKHSISDQIRHNFHSIAYVEFLLIHRDAMAEEGSTFRYKRPTSDAQTCHLLLGGQEQELLSLKDTLMELGAINVTSPAAPLLTHCFCSFQSPAAAASAADVITTDPTRYGKIITKFADAVMQKPSSTQQHPQPHVLAVESAEECDIPGLSLVLNFVTVEEEEALLAEVDDRPWDSLARRKVQHYGRPFNYLVSGSFE